jgi:hypothetical protein
MESSIPSFGAFDLIADLLILIILIDGIGAEFD